MQRTWFGQSDIDWPGTAPKLETAASVHAAPVSTMIEAAPCLHLLAPHSLLTLLGGRSTARLQGSITFNGNGLSKASKRKLGYVAQVRGVSYHLRGLCSTRLQVAVVQEYAVAAMCLLNGGYITAACCPVLTRAGRPAVCGANGVRGGHTSMLAGCQPWCRLSGSACCRIIYILACNG